MAKTDLLLNTCMDVANVIAVAMNAKKVTTAELARKLGFAKARMEKILSGDDESLTLGALVKIFQALDHRLDVVATPAAVNEWDVKRAIVRLEKRFMKGVRA